MLSKIRQSPKDKYYRTPLSYSEASHSWKQKVEWWLPGAREEETELFLMSIYFQFCKMKNFYGLVT